APPGLPVPAPAQAGGGELGVVQAVEQIGDRTPGAGGRGEDAHRSPSLRSVGASRKRCVDDSLASSLIALPRCARSALRESAVSMIRSQARSSAPPPQ